MPYRNGRVVKWKAHIQAFADVMSEDMDTRRKLKKLADVVDDNRVFQEDDFAERLRDASAIENFYECEAIGDEVISDIYDFADQNLIWLGA